MELKVKIEKEELLESISNSYSKKLLENSRISFMRRDKVEERANELIKNGFLDKEIKLKLKESLKDADFVEVMKQILKDRFEDDD